MDIEEAKKVLKELKENKYGELLNCYDQGEEAERAIETVLNELDKDNNIISDLQNEVTLKQCELDNKDKIINEMGEHIEKGCDFDSTIQTKQQVIDYFAKKVSEK